MNEQQFGYRIKQNLNQGLPLDSVTLNRLKAAREMALEHQRASAPSYAFAWAQNGISYFNRPLAPRLLLSGLILLLGLLVTNYWHQAQLIEENVEIDAAVLTGELPIDAYLDKGFGAWLKSSLE
jgi:Protein of unknown function (DUF3619)